MRAMCWPSSSNARNTKEHMRILLWDIDGTLMRSARTGAYKDYTIPVLEEIFGTAGRLAEMEAALRPQNAADLNLPRQLDRAVCLQHMSERNDGEDSHRVQVNEAKCARKVTGA